MQRFSITALSLGLFVSCSRQVDPPTTIPAPVTDPSSEAPVVGPAEFDRPDRFERPGLTGDSWILELESGDVPEPPLSPSLLDGPDVAVAVEPRLPIAPPSGADAITIAFYVAVVWGNTGPEIVPWHEATRAFLTDEFSESLARDHLAVGQLIASATAVQASSYITPTGDRVTVSLEHVLASSEVTWRLVTVELLLVDVDGRALVAALEVVG